MGSKAKYAKYILPIILKDRRPGQFYVEPFVGSGNLIAKVDGNRIGADINNYLISFHLAMQNGWTPPENVSEQEYNDIRLNKDKYPPELVAFVMFSCSYAAKFGAGYARGKNSKGEYRNYALEGKNNCLGYKPKLDGVIFKCCSYDELEIPNNSIIYNDIPYKNTTKYKDKFDHAKFWIWAENMVNKGHKVFVSEYSAPENWNCVWHKEVFNSLTKNTGSKKGIEKLFTLDKKDI